MKFIKDCRYTKNKVRYDPGNYLECAVSRYRIIKIENNIVFYEYKNKGISKVYQGNTLEKYFREDDYLHPCTKEKYNDIYINKKLTVFLARPYGNIYHGSYVRASHGFVFKILNISEDQISYDYKPINYRSPIRGTGAVSIHDFLPDSTRKIITQEEYNKVP